MMDFTSPFATAPRRLTTHPDSDASPQWAPDGSAVYFLSTRGGSSQVWQIDPRGGEARQVTDLPLDVGGFLVSPDGKRLAVSIEVFPDCGTLDCTVDRLRMTGESPVSGRFHDRVFVRRADARAVVQTSGGNRGRYSHTQSLGDHVRTGPP